MTKNGIIIALAAIILAGLYWHYQRGASLPVQAHQDSVTVARSQIKVIQAREKELIARIRQDSAQHAQDIKTYRDKAEKLKRHIASISFKMASIQQLDSARVVIFNSAGTEGDTLYTLPLDQARDLIELKAQQPARDSLDVIQDQRIALLEQANRDQWDGLNAVVRLKNEELTKERELNKHFEAIADHYRKASKRSRAGKWLDRGTGIIAGFALGRIK